MQSSAPCVFSSPPSHFLGQQERKSWQFISTMYGLTTQRWCLIPCGEEHPSCWLVSARVTSAVAYCSVFFFHCIHSLSASSEWHSAFPKSNNSPETGVLLIGSLTYFLICGVSTTSSSRQRSHRCSHILGCWTNWINLPSITFKAD